VPGPPVSLAVGPADQKNAVGIGSEDDRDRRQRTIGVFNENGRSGGEPRRELRDPAQCESVWQEPPPQPPPGSGPRLLKSKS